MEELIQNNFLKGEVLSDKCPSREILKHLTNKWAFLIMYALKNKTLRFSDLRRTLSGVSEKMLSQNLQILESDGFINRVSYQVIPPHVEYSLTPIGEEAAEKMIGLVAWIEENLIRIYSASQNK